MTLTCGEYLWHIKSTPAAHFLRKARGIWIGAVTVGEEISDAVRTAMNNGDTARAAILDAVGSECADAVMDALQQFSAHPLARQGYTIDQRRFSPGYGAWGLDAQKHFFQLLKLEELQMTLSGTFIIQPEKSVTAIAPLY